MPRRILIFSIGFLFGCVLVYQTMFKNSDRDFYGGWLPDGRVLKKINLSLNRDIPNYECLLTCHQLFDSDVQEILKKGDVRFAECETKTEPKIYVVEGELESGSHVKMKFSLAGDSARLMDILIPK